MFPQKLVFSPSNLFPESDLKAKYRKNIYLKEITVNREFFPDFAGWLLRGC